MGVGEGLEDDLRRRGGLELMEESLWKLYVGVSMLLYFCSVEMLYEFMYVYFGYEGCIFVFCDRYSNIGFEGFVEIMGGVKSVIFW